jgi:hypothetical protein
MEWEMEASVRSTGNVKHLRAVRALALLVASALAFGGFGAASARADGANVISSLRASVSSGSAPVNSLTDSGGVTYSPPAGSGSPQAGSDDNFTESLTFAYGGGAGGASGDGTPDKTIQTVTLALPPGLLDRLGSAAGFCTDAELGQMPTDTTAGTGWLGGNAGCPAASQIGSLSGTVNALGLDQPITGNVYIMAANSPSDVARIAVEVDVIVLGLLPARAEVASGPIDFALDADGQPQLTAALTLPARATLGSAGSAATTLLPYTLEALTQTINGLTPAHQPFQIMPSSNATTVATTRVSVQDNGNAGGSGPLPGTTDPDLLGSAQASLTPTGAESLPYAPQLTTSVVRDPGDAVVAFTNTITQAADEAPSSSITLRIPSNLQPHGAAALPEACQTPAPGFTNCTQVGAVTAATPLLDTPLTGSLYLTGPPLAPSLVLSFPQPFAISIAGSVDLAANTVTFANVPDMPLTSLAVALAGGAQGIFETTCTTANASGSVSASFTAQNGASANSSGAYSINDCPPPPPSPATTPPTALQSSPSPGLPALTPPAPYVPPRAQTGPGVTSRPSTPRGPAVSAGRLQRVGKRSARLTLALANNPGAPAFHVIRLTAPAGARFVAKHLARYVRTGATHQRVVLSHGQLVITLSGDAVETQVTVFSNVLALTPALARKVAAKQTTRLKLKIALTTTRRTTEQIVGTLAVS